MICSNPEELFALRQPGETGVLRKAAFSANGVAVGHGRSLTSDHLVEHQTSGVDIAACIHVVPGELFGCHVRGSSYDHALRG